MTGAGLDEGFEPRDELARLAGHADAKHAIVDERAGFVQVALLHDRVLDLGKIPPGQLEALEDER